MLGSRLGSVLSSRLAESVDQPRAGSLVGRAYTRLARGAIGPTTIRGGRMNSTMNSNSAKIRQYQNYNNLYTKIKPKLKAIWGGSNHTFIEQKCTKHMNQNSSKKWTDLVHLYLYLLLLSSSSSSSSSLQLLLLVQ